MSIVIIPVCDFINFEINLIAFFSSHFSTLSKDSGQNSEYLKNEKNF